MGAKTKPVTLDEVANEVRMWQSRGLGAGWMIEIVEGQDEDNSAAFTMWASGYRWGKIVVNLKDGSFAHPQLWRHVVIHELCHFVTAPVIDFLEANLNKEGPLFSELRRHFETVTDSFALIIQENGHVD